MQGADRRVPCAGEGGSSSSKSIPYNRRVLLKGLLRTIAISSYAPGSTARPQVAYLATLNHRLPERATSCPLGPSDVLGAPCTTQLSRGRGVRMKL